MNAEKNDPQNAAGNAAPGEAAPAEAPPQNDAAGTPQAGKPAEPETDRAAAGEPEAGAPSEAEPGADGAPETGAGADAPAGDGTQTDERAERIAALEGEVGDLRDQLLRAMAEADNTRKRAERRIEDAHRYAAAGLARDILSVADNIERALDAVPEDRRAEHELLQTLLDGVIAVRKDFAQALAAHKIERIDALGQPFDPNLHEAMFEVPDSSLPAGTVAQVIQPGYRLHDRLLRPARVGVAKAAPENGDDRNADGGDDVGAGGNDSGGSAAENGDKNDAGA